MYSSAFPILLLLLLISQSIPSYNVILAVVGEVSTTREHMFTPKGYLIRHWNNKIPNNIPIFLLNKASPLTAAEFAAFVKLAEDQNTLSSNLPDFCTKANLFCSPIINSSPTLQNHNDINSNFSSFLDRPFHHYLMRPFTHYNYDTASIAQSKALYSYNDLNLHLDANSGDTNIPIKVVEEGKFFREAMLKSGNVMHMPDIRDKMPKRSFLPSLIVSKLPFSVSKISQLQNIFNESSMTSILASSLSECESAPSPGETKQCVASIEDMVDFSTSVLGRNVTVRTTESSRGYNGTIMIGQVKGINSGNVTKSISCHQSLFPSLLYVCHSVPKVRVYEADILDPKSQVKINHGVAICHLDTSSWSPGHSAFIALGSQPGKIEVCHWIFENDMAWTLTE